MDTLDDLGAQLRALSSGQPAQPGNRVPGVTRRAGRIRRTRAALAVGASLAVLAPAGLLVTSAQHHQDTTFARSDLLTWPDRSVEADKGIGDGAVAALGQSTGADVAKVRWLYRARVRMPVPNPAYVAVFTAEVQGQDLLVVATSFGHELDSSGLTTDDETPVASWDTDDRTVLEPGKPLTHVGAYLPYTLGDVHSSFAVVLADARARTLTWTYAPLPFAPPVSTGVGPAPVPSRNGVFLVDLQAITGPATV
ncbi:MAG TPA: hypothetical protein VM097_13135, partial [Mycobacteriales bacterium]|nr:hypothetical protein [Mycobacteriales bacterium]